MHYEEVEKRGHCNDCDTDACSDYDDYDDYDGDGDNLSVML